MRLFLYKFLADNVFRLKHITSPGISAPLACFQRTFQKHVHFLSTLKQTIVSDLSHDIDIDSLKSKAKLLANQGEQVNLHKMMEEELEKRCHQFLDIFSSKPDQLKKLKVVQLEHSHLASEGYAVLPPEKMTSKNWVEALICSSSDERLTYFLFTGYKAAKKEERQKEIMQGELEKTGEDTQGIILTDVEMTRSSRSGNHRLSSAMQFGLPMIIDMDFEGKMTSKEIGQTAKQLWMAYCTNRRHTQPFHLILTGCSQTNSVYRTLELRHLLDCDHFLVTRSEDSYLDLYPHSDIIYLTPHAKQCVEKFDPTKVYILAAYSDLLTKNRMAIAKSKEQQIQFQRLPLDEHIKWVQGNKDLFLNVILQILLNVKETNNWKEALAQALPPKLFKHY